jgi:hypothetical protein
MLTPLYTYQYRFAFFYVLSNHRAQRRQWQYERTPEVLISVSIPPFCIDNSTNGMGFVKQNIVLR